MDAELIVLFKICDVRSHFCVSIRSAILFVDRLEHTVASGPFPDAGKKHIKKPASDGLAGAVALLKVGMPEQSRQSTAVEPLTHFGVYVSRVT
jgi:hypothetical protein